MLTAIVGINWGDEGKGRMVDLLSEEQDVVVRYQGGNNAGHTVINEQGKFVLNLLPSGILRSNVTNIMGNGMVVDLKHLCGEIEKLKSAGVKITQDNLKISDKAVLCMPYHVLLDCLEEDRLGDKKYGSTRRGIAPAYGDKYLKKAIRMCDLLDDAALAEKISEAVIYKNKEIKGVYGEAGIELREALDWVKEYGGRIKTYICDAGSYLDNAVRTGKRIMFEAQLGALRDIDFGIYPYTSSSSTIAAYAPIGAGIPQHKLDKTIGIIKAYSSCVGEGPFTCEIFGDEAHALREAGGEYGAATGRPRRVGGFDAVASKYGVQVQGADEIALTKLDVLSYMHKIPVCIAYNIDGVETTSFPTGEKLSRAKPVYKYLEGWECDISQCRQLSDLPRAASDYIEFVEKAADCKIKYVSVGAERQSYVRLQ